MASKIPENVKKLLLTKNYNAEMGNLFEELDEEEKQMYLYMAEDSEEDKKKEFEMREEERKNKKRKLVFSNSGVFKMRWDLLIIVLVIFNAIELPFVIAWQGKYDSIEEDIIGYVIDIVFVFDIVLNFRTGYIHPKTGIEVLNPKSIALNYLKSWRFYTDLLSVIPFELMNTKNTQAKSFKVFNLLKLVRLLRLGRIITFLKLKQNVKTGFRIILLLALLIIVVHWFGCMWFLTIQRNMWMPPVQVDVYLTKIKLFEQYMYCFYYALVMILGNEAFPVDNIQKIFVSIAVITGSFLMAFIFGNITALMDQLKSKNTEFEEQLDKLTLLMRAIRLPEKVQYAVENYLINLQKVPDMSTDMGTFLMLISP